MKKLIYAISILFCLNIFGQNKPILYDFAELPQTLLLNPALETNYKFHIGFPLLSGFSLEVGSSKAVLLDLFGVDNRTINEKVSQLINTMSPRDFAKFNMQIEILSGGYRYDDGTYFSFGFYNEVDAIGYFPKDTFVLFNEGNDAHLNRSFSASEIRYKLDLVGVLHAGVTRKLNEKLTLGARFKIYSSALNLETNNNSGTFTTVEGNNNLYTHYFDNVGINLKTSGLVDSNTDEFIQDAGTFLGNTFFGNNLGVGLDFGLVYKITDQVEFSASIIDFGFINHKKNIKNTKVNGNFVFEGVDFTFDPNSNVNYWQQIDQRFKENLPTTQVADSYISWRPTKLNAAIKYSFGERRSKYCYDNTYKDFYTDAIGVQLFNVFRPLSPQLALTTFYKKSISKKVHTKFTYTIDDFSFSNIGAGLSFQFGALNFYGMFDNLLAYRNLATANSVSLQLGVNFIFN